MQLLDRRTRLQTQLLNQHRAGRLIGVQRLRLPARAVQRQHQLPPQPLPKGMRRSKSIKLADEICMPSEREVSLDPLFQTSQAKLDDPLDLAASPLLVGEVGKRRAAEKPQSPRQLLRRRSQIPSRQRGWPALKQILETSQVDLLARERQSVARRLGHDQLVGVIRGQQLTQLRDVALDRGQRLAGPVSGQVPR